MAKPILLALDSSEQSYFASQLCLRLAERWQVPVTAQHVVDTSGAWRLLHFERPGLLGSGPHIDAYNQISEALTTVGRKLLEVYEAHASGAKIKLSTFLDYGNPLVEICARAVDYHLVIAGHRPTELKLLDSKRPADRVSLAANLAHSCSRPLLIVQRQCQPWNSIRIVTEANHLNEYYIHQSLKLASALGVEPEVVCLLTGVHDERSGDLVRDLRLSDSTLTNVRISTSKIASLPIGENLTAWWASDQDVEGDGLRNALTVMPTRVIGDQRTTVFGSSPDFFLRHLVQSSILLWPEEYSPETLTKTGAFSTTEAAASSVG